jgi:hypothetical protein
MGMETLPERMQREVPVPVEVGNTSDTHTSGAAPEDLSSSAPSTSKVLDPSNSEVLSGDIASASEIHPAYKDDMVWQVMIIVAWQWFCMGWSWDWENDDNIEDAGIFRQDQTFWTMILYGGDYEIERTMII